ncbi:MAG: DEAD/DEAH box helicase, partial [Elusimicrobiales bacterium]
RPSERRGEVSSLQPFLDYDQRSSRFKLYAPFTYRDVAVESGAVWDGRGRFWWLESVPRELVDRLRREGRLSGAAEAVIREDERRREFFASLHTARDAEVAFGEGLDPYQRVGVKFLAEAKRALLADPPGVGKSAQAIRAACEVGARRVLVVTRKSLIHNWERQLDLWLPPGSRVEFEVTNYEQVVRRLDELAKRKFDVLIVDESAAVKNRKAKRSQAVAKLARKVPYVWLLTGTPVLNRPDELWMQLHILYPDRYRSYWRFVERYCTLEHNPWSGGWKVVGLNPVMAKALSEELSTVLLRRPRSVINLPDITREVVYVRLSGQQERIYREMERDFVASVSETEEVYAPSVVAQLVRLRQITCTPALIGGPDSSAKTEALLDLVESYAPDYKLLVFTNFARYVENLAPKLSGFGAVTVTGSMTAAQRAAAVRRFNEDPGCRVLLGTIGAVGEGLNLQGADVVVFLDKPWVPVAVEQAEARAHRRGREAPVHVVTLVAAGTVDEYVEEVLAGKEKLVREFDVVARLVAVLREKAREGGGVRG